MAPNRCLENVPSSMARRAFPLFSDGNWLSRMSWAICILSNLSVMPTGRNDSAPLRPGVNMPVLMIQVLRDSWTRNPEDAQKTFDLLGSKEKELFWIEGTTRRFKDGYNYFRRHPEKVLAFFDKYMK